MMSSPRPNFSDLRELHICANDLLLSPQIQQALVDHHQQEMPSVREISEASLKMLDLCGATRDALLLVKEHFQDLQQSFRRAKIEGSDFEAQISAHAAHRKKLKKDLAKCMRDIKGMKSKYFTSELSLIDHSLIVVVHVLREVRGATILILESLLSLMTLPLTITIVHSQRSLASKFMRVNCQRFLERCDSMEVRMANKRLEQVQGAISDLEDELECIIRRLMQTRVCLLNILTS